MKNLILRTCLALVCLAAFSTGTKAQFKEEAFSQSYNDPSDTTGAARDSVDKMWSFREFFRGVSHKDTTLRIGTMFAGSTVFIGAEQIYNRQYWKLPVIYGGLGATIGMGIHYNSKYRHSKKGYDIAMKLDPDMEFDLDTHSWTESSTIRKTLGTSQARQHCIPSFFPDSVRLTTASIGKSRSTGG